MSRFFPCVLAVLLSSPAFLLVGRGQASAEKETPVPKVICPAVQVEGQRDFYDSSPHVERRQPELVVLGKVRPAAGDKSAKTYEIEVEKVLAGSWPGKTVLLDGFWITERAIFSLTQTHLGEATAFHRRWEFEVEEEKAVRALYAARLDYHTLAAECIFIGKEVDVLDEEHHVLEVVKPVAGWAPEAGRRVTVSGPREYWGWRGKPLFKESLIYFIPVIEREPRRMPGQEVKGPVYHFNWRQPVEQEAAVRAALGRRDEYPINEVEEYGKKVRCREVLFRGSTAEAIAMLGSHSKALVALGSRKLICDGQAAHPAVLAALEPGLPLTDEQKRGDFRVLHNLIKTLDTRREKSGTASVLDQLLDRYLAHVALDPPGLTKPLRGFGRYPAEEENEDVNHALTWLLQQCDLDTVHRRYGPRLLQLRDKVKGHWKQEVQLALDVCRIEDQVELEAALLRMKDQKPVRSTPADRRVGVDSSPKAEVADLFFADDRTIRTISRTGTICLWDAATLRLQSRVAMRPSFYVLSARLPDGRYLACLDMAVPEGEKMHVVDAETGRVISSPTLPGERTFNPWVYWANDREAILLNGKWAVRFDYQKGKTIRDVACEQTPSGRSAAALSADGTLLQWIDADPRGGVVTIRALNLTNGKVFEIGKRWMACAVEANVVPGGKYFHVGPLHLLDRKTTDVVAAKALRGFYVGDVTFNADGSRAAVVTERHQQDWQHDRFPTGKTIRILHLPSLKTIAAISSVPSASRVRFAPDGQRLAVLNTDDTLELWDLSSLGKP